MMHDIRMENGKKVKDQSSNAAVFHAYLSRFNTFMDYAYSKPMTFVEDVVDRIYNIVVNNQLACSLCLCTTLTLTICATSIAVGVGVGVGVGCS